MTKDLSFFKKMKENSSVNDEKDNVLLVLRKVSERNCFSKNFIDGFSLINCGILFQNKHPIIVVQNLLC